MPNLSIDLLSFVLGFLAATAFWWIGYRLWKLFPALLAFVKLQREAARKRRQAGIRADYLQEVLARCQKQHISARLFSLDEIFIEPSIILPPSLPDPTAEGATLSLTSQLVPVLADWPEFCAEFPIPRAPLTALLDGKANYVLTARPGFGKTTALAGLVCKIIRHGSHSPNRPDRTPIFLHCRELDFAQLASQTPAEALLAALANRSGVFSNKKAQTFLRQSIEHKEVVVILDGLDELQTAGLTQISDFLARFVKNHPDIQVIASADPDHLAGLLQAGFFTVPLSAWDHRQRAELSKRWLDLWNNHISPAILEKTGGKSLSPHILSSWLSSTTPVVETPFELTLRLWSACAGDLAGDKSYHALEAYLDRLAGSNLPRLPLAHLAAEMVNSPDGQLDGSVVEKTIARALKTETSEPIAAFPGLASQPTGRKRSPSRSQLLSRLIDSGILVENLPNRFSFVHLWIAGYLTSFSDEYPNPSSPHLPLPFTKVLQMRYLAARNINEPWVTWLKEQSDPILLRPLLTLARCLPDAPLGGSLRSNTMRGLIETLQDDTLPFSIRARLMAGVLGTNDPALPMLLKQLLNAESTPLRRLAAISCGILRDNRVFDDLAQLLNDPEGDVSASACLALAAYDSPSADAILKEALLHGEEMLRNAAAEALAFGRLEQRQILEEALSSSDIVTRRAVVHGLSLLEDEWSLKHLEAIAVQDGQWVVRSAAGEAVNRRHKTKSMLPDPLPPAVNAPWLIQFASQLGEGLSPGIDHTPLILRAWKEGEPDQRLAALAYIERTADRNLASALYPVIFDEHDDCRENALASLHNLAAAGVDLPPPQEFGFH